MEKYICNACGYIYDPAAGDPDNLVCGSARQLGLPAVRRRQGYVQRGISLPGTKASVRAFPRGFVLWEEGSFLSYFYKKYG